MGNTPAEEGDGTGRCGLTHPEAASNEMQDPTAKTKTRRRIKAKCCGTGNRVTVAVSTRLLHCSSGGYAQRQIDAVPHVEARRWRRTGIQAGSRVGGSRGECGWRAQWLGVGTTGENGASVKLVVETNVEYIVTNREAGKPPALGGHLIGSRCSGWTAVESVLGTVGQGRTFRTNSMIRYAEALRYARGRVGGTRGTRKARLPAAKVVEQMVDAVNRFRRRGRPTTSAFAVKNRLDRPTRSASSRWGVRGSRATVRSCSGPRSPQGRAGVGRIRRNCRRCPGAGGDTGRSPAD